MTTIFDPNQTPTASIGYQNIPNIIDNGGMSIWQRGTTFTNPVNAVYTADRWRTFGGPSSTWTISQETTIVDPSGSQGVAMKVLITAVSESILGVLYYVENWPDYVGKTVTVSARVRSTVAGKISVIINDGQQANGAYNTLTNTYETISVSKTIVNIGQNRIYIAIGQVDSVVTPVPLTYYIDNVMMTIGNQVVSFVPTDPQADLARCQRYYEIGTVGSLTLPIANITAIRTEIDFAWNFCVTKRTVPTMTITTTQSTQLQLAPGAFGTVGDPTSAWPSTASPTVNSFQITANRGSNSTYPLLAYTATWTASADL